VDPVWTPPPVCNLTHCHLPTGHATETILISNWTELKWQFKSQSYIATDGRSISKCWCRAPNWQSLLASFYIVTGRTTAQKTHPLPSSEYMRTNIQNTSCDTGYIVVFTAPLLIDGSYPIVEWVYCIVDWVFLRACLLRRSLEMGLLYCWLRIFAGLFIEAFPRNGSTLLLIAYFCGLVYLGVP
jgi:hypothetical protein